MLLPTLRRLAREKTTPSSNHHHVVTHPTAYFTYCPRSGRCVDTDKLPRVIPSRRPCRLASSYYLQQQPNSLSHMTATNTGRTYHRHNHVVTPHSLPFGARWNSSASSLSLCLCTSESPRGCLQRSVPHFTCLFLGPGPSLLLRPRPIWQHMGCDAQWARASNIMMIVLH